MGKGRAVPTFGKEALLKAKRYAGQCDVLDVVLRDDREYKLAEVAKLVDDFLKGKV